MRRAILQHMARPVSPPPELEDVVERVQAHRAELEAMGVRYLGVFGSVARGDARPDSDVDLLVEFSREQPRSWDVNDYLIELLGRHVDVVPRELVKTRLKNRIEAESIEVLPEFNGRHDMPPKQPREWRHYIDDMVEAAETIIAYTNDLDAAALAADAKTRQSLAWNFQVLGEAIRNLPREVQDAHPEIPWGKIRGLRNEIVHGYFRINPDILWKVATTEVPPIVEPLRHLLAEDS